MLEQKLYTFIKLAECQSTTKTALELHMTQPAVSQQLKALENEYNVTLFSREGRKIILTKEGKKFYQMIKRMITIEQQFISLIKQPPVKTIRFGVTLSISEGVMPYLLPKMAEYWKDTRFEMITQNTHELLFELENGMIDFALIEGNFDKKSYASDIFMEEEFCGFCKKGSEYRNFTKLEDCLSAPLILREKGSGTRDIFESECMAHNIKPENFIFSHEVDNIPVIMSMIKKDMGITFAYRCAAQRELEEEKIEKIPLENFSLKRSFSFVTLPDTLKTESIMDICSVIKKLAVKNIID